MTRKKAVPGTMARKRDNTTSMNHWWGDRRSDVLMSETKVMTNVMIKIIYFMETDQYLFLNTSDHGLQ